MGLHTAMTIQSENYVPESSPGAGDGKGWRLDKNGDFQIGTMSMIDGVIRSPHATVHIDRAMVDQASIAPAQLDLPIHQVHGDVTEIVVRIDLPGVIDEMTATRKSSLHEEIKRLVMDAATGPIKQGMRTGRITQEVTCRADADMALAQRIGSLDVRPGSDWGVDVDGQVKHFPEKFRDVVIGTATINMEQPGGPVSIADLVETIGKVARLGGPALTGEEFLYKKGDVSVPDLSREFAGGLLRDPLKGVYRDIMPTKDFLAEHVGTKLKPEVACALSMCAPVTGNGKVPVNNLPRPVDDGK